MSDITVLKMKPVLAEKPWGGRRLAAYGKDLPAGALIGESWEVADLPDDSVATVAEARSRVADGPHAGKTLRRLIAEFGSELLGSASASVDGDFPLLVKILDAREHLSVQVHPDRDYVEEHPDARLKTESWYVIDADPGALLYLGLREGVTVSDIASRIGTAGIAGLLHEVPARPGDFHHLPAGLVHALGAGVVVAEVQTPSDTTFRMYDWEDRYRRPDRPMHPTAALEAIDVEATSAHSTRPAGPGSRELLTREVYWIVEHRGAAPSLDPSPEVRIVLVVAGQATVDGIELGTGTTAILPAAIVPEIVCEASSDAILLEIGLPQGKLAE